ncbi:MULTISPECIES: Nif3-like dinuclear metal center hexameric protein [Allobacillus]|uniref:GTP cyclohydrolase 1 type 2 homolog n=1 Tax=Allobacillus halotolerans TaxID=570278 RepID=A0ABS6GM18_9BACI|nr:MULTISPECIES: Nif3-like dinuclear metal center hexameric protein [Allobacillus]MBU6079685.1 Nif3-like dinuclear metal center hexameric protein [Allobacillus halotolerans]TSJ68214.1 Nif3-like dinuclear metal center hexameric protein [Allobacillus sp. SKP2-8]
MTKVKDVMNVMEEIAPKKLAFEGDRIGLQVGSPNSDANRIMVTLDVLESVVDEAIEKEIDLIIAHHPFIFKPFKEINWDSEKGRITKKLLTHNISLFVAHTNLDIARGGVNDLLMEKLDLTDTDVLVKTTEEKLYKLVIHVPKSHENQIRQAFADAGAGFIGNYSHCTFNLEGIGTFKPQEGANPYIGSEDELERVEEYRMDTIVPEGILNQTIELAKKAHPYEEMAYDVYPLKVEGESYGLGRIAKLAEPMKLRELAQLVKKAYDVPNLRFVGKEDKNIRTIAVIGGDGNKYISQAKRMGADVLITGDVYFHTAHDALGMGLAMIDPGHHIEQVMKEGLQQQLKEKMPSLQVHISNQKTEPFTFLTTD